MSYHHIQPAEGYRLPCRTWAGRGPLGVAFGKTAN